MNYPFSWLGTLSRVAIYFVVVALIGLYFGNVSFAVALGALALLALTYWKLNRLSNWLWHSKKMSPPKVRGIWEHIYDGIYTVQRRNRRKRKELGTIVRSFREGSEALPDAAVVVDANAAILWCNRLARIELGLRWPDDSGRRIYNFIRHPKFIEFYHKGRYDYPIELPSPANAEKVLEYRIMPYGDKHLMLLIRDVTQLIQIEKMRKDFVANVSHELRTPLTVINGYLEILPGAKDMPEDFANKAFEEMRSQSLRMQSLIEELLILSRIEASNERIHENVVDVPHMLQMIKLEGEALNKVKKHTIIMRIDPSLHVYGIESELRSAFSNLLFNAIHYTPNNGHIWIDWKVVGLQARFSVRDDGEGIEAKHLIRLTERFYRVDKARSRQTGGSGLGLAIVKHVLNHHNSTLEISSKVGRGSEFSFELSQELCINVADAASNVVQALE
jgi:two-component system phosphate regulon sensor histidine kinase PhoR